jgi:hypothetical protein
MASAAKVLKMPKGGVITQAQLSEYLKKDGQLKALKKELTDLEDSLFKALKAKATVQSGALSATISRGERRNVSWKEVVQREIDESRGKGEGEKFTERVLAATKPTPTESLSVYVVEA